jgi:hypothetical protein
LEHTVTALEVANENRIGSKLRTQLLEASVTNEASAALQCVSLPEPKCRDPLSKSVILAENQTAEIVTDAKKVDRVHQPRLEVRVNQQKPWEECLLAKTNRGIAAPLDFGGFLCDCRNSDRAESPVQRGRDRILGEEWVLRKMELEWVGAHEGGRARLWGRNGGLVDHRPSEQLFRRRG